MLEKDENLGIIIQMGLSNIVNMFMIKSAVTDLRHELVPAEERGQRESNGERPDECEQNVNLKKIPRFLDRVLNGTDFTVILSILYRSRYRTVPVPLFEFNFSKTTRQNFKVNKFS